MHPSDVASAGAAAVALAATNPTLNVAIGTLISIASAVLARIVWEGGAWVVRRMRGQKDPGGAPYDPPPPPGA